MRNLLITLTLLAGLSLLSFNTLAGGDGGKTVEVSIVKFKFEPAEITVNPGDTVRWVNKEKRQYHSVWFEALGEPEPDYMFPGDIYERTFDSAGDFPYRCGPHPKMLGAVKVK